MTETRQNQTGCEKSCGEIEVPTKEEVAALSVLREIKERVRELKRRKTELLSHKKGAEVEELSAIDKEMADLRVRWEKWEEKRNRAAKERMILLGHESPFE